MAPEEVVLERTVEVPRTDACIAVVSDTHSRPHSALVAQLEAVAPVLVLHAGDVGRLTVLDELASVAPVLVVRGNVDERSSALPDHIALTLTREAHPVLRVLLTHYAIQRMRLTAAARARAFEHGAQLVVCGHSHVPFVGKDGALALFNPGAAGPRRFRLPITFGILTLSDRGVALGHRNLETGAQWRP
ncbi:MAG: metallophosphoesterase family protein [bacterium]